MEKTIDKKEKLEQDLIDLEVNLQRVTSLLFILKEYSWEIMSKGYDIPSKDTHEAITHIFQSLELIHEKLDRTTDVIDRNIRHEIEDLIKAAG